MAQQADNNDTKFNALRNEFDDLQIEEKAAFLIESGFSFLTHGVDSMVRLIRNEMDNMASGSSEASDEVDVEEEEGVAEDSNFAKDIASEDDSDNAEPDGENA